MLGIRDGGVLIEFVTTTKVSLTVTDAVLIVRNSSAGRAIAKTI